MGFATNHVRCYALGILLKGKRGFVQFLPLLGAIPTIILIIGFSILALLAVLLGLFVAFNLLQLVGGALLIIGGLTYLQGRYVPKFIFIIGFILIIAPMVLEFLKPLTLGNVLSMLGG